MQNRYYTEENKFAEVRKLGRGYYQVDWFSITTKCITRTSISYSTNRRKLHKTLSQQEQAYKTAIPKVFDIVGYLNK